MHELSIMGNILEIILEYAKKNKAKIIKIINLDIGELSDVMPEWAQNYFEMLSKDTIADSALLNINRIPIKIKCKSCLEFFKTTKQNLNFICPYCQSTEVALITGKELRVTSIEIE